MTRRTLRRLLIGLPLLVLAGLSLTCSPGYVVRAGWEEAKILSRRRPIPDVIADAGTSETVRRKLRLVQQARTYARSRLELDVGDSYTTYSWVDSDTLLMVLSAAYPDRFAAYTWWFPIVGRVPYKGFFDFDRAWAEADRLAARGFDTYVRPSGAFSTLGWFNDPLLNTLLRYPDVALANTVIHELLHNSIYLPGQAGFNESFANFVGDRGAIDFFCNRDGDTAATCRQARDGWQDNLTYGAFLSDLVLRLETLYGRTDLDRTAKLAQKETVLSEARTRFARDVRPRLLTGAFHGFEAQPLNNATLIGTRLYYQRLDLFDAVFRRYRNDLRATIHAVIGAAEARPDQPFQAVETLLQ
ncbi:MAG TPA: aminopeptidase [Longimicrobiales bacterium]|nr:aminopeptidase [Longimicrobiales bacterium]